MQQESAIDVSWVATDFDVNRLGPENVWEVTRHLLDACPFARGRDARGPYTTVARYADVLGVLQNWKSFGSGPGKYIAGDLPMLLPPIDVDPPMQRHVREILNPFFAPDRVGSFEPEIRDIVDGFLAVFPEGPFDIGEALFQPLPPILAFRFLLGLPSEELDEAKTWIHETLFLKGDHDVSGSTKALKDWLQALIAQHREGRGDSELINALIRGTTNGRAFTDDELVGTLMNLLFAGFHTTTDSGGGFLVRLAENPGLQTLLRREPTKIPAAIEEHLRLVPAVPHVARVCNAATAVGGHAASPGDRLDVLLTAANRDPDEFADPEEFSLDRGRNRHLAFGAGVHRCIGSHFARLTLRVVFEQLLSRFGHVEIAPGARVEVVSNPPFLWYVLERIPVCVRPS